MLHIFQGLKATLQSMDLECPRTVNRYQQFCVCMHADMTHVINPIELVLLSLWGTVTSTYMCCPICL